MVVRRDVPDAAGGRPVAPSDDLVQQRDRDAVRGHPVRLELGVPRRPHQLVQRVHLCQLFLKL